MFDPFWRLANDSGITVLYHGGDSRYSNYLGDWGEGGHTESFRANAFRGIASPNPTQDTLANLLAHGHFHRSRTCGWPSSRPAPTGYSTCTRS